ncbi:transmembrane anchor protein [Sphingopyxis sp. LK2115]|uniref:transmembrane anchor protein n=1 Tax=Sphingopyxis sp. LK2115 TaxID=2744558 RepID=UPI00166112FC|nr:transmembrane anchor protein [Sphingopyxis sp. LK2115]
MFNSQRPKLEELPTTGQLLRATALAIAAAGAILVTVVLPSEYAIDPTGIGRQLGLTQMGEIKAQLAEEAAQDAAAEAAGAAPAAVATETAAAPKAAEAGQRTDTMKLTLAPGQGAEIKATMTNGAKLSFDWSVEGGRVNFDTHGDAPGVDYHGYGKGKETAGEKGELVAAFDGKHGWFWRNRSGAPVTITLRTQGAYTDIRRVV